MGVFVVIREIIANIIITISMRVTIIIMFTIIVITALSFSAIFLQNLLRY